MFVLCVDSVHFKLFKIVYFIYKEKHESENKLLDNKRNRLISTNFRSEKKIKFMIGHLFS